MFDKTTILPTDNPQLAKELFNRLVFEEARILLLVFGNDTEAKETVEKASKLAGAVYEPHWVVWIRDYNPVSDQILSLNGAAELNGNLSDLRLLALNISDTIKDIIKIDEGTPDFARIQLAWMKAEGF